jgi:predicted acyltransferase
MPAARHLSLDVFRGATVALMILVNNPGSWKHLYPPLAHADWHGCTPTDLVFPFFLFAVGNALAFVMPGLLAGPAAVFWRKVAQRSLLIFAIGLFLNASPFVRWAADGELVWRSWETLRTMGVLQRIALCFGAAAVVVWTFGRRGALVSVVLLLAGYWVACLTLGNAAAPYSLEGFFGTPIDRALLGTAHMYKGEGVPFDPEGLVSTLPAIAQVLLGYLVGEKVQRSPLDMTLVAQLCLAAIGLLVLAYLWQLQMPLNKKIWTSSYVLHTTGLAMLALALLIYALEIQRSPGPWMPLCRFFEWFGKNPLFIFVLSGFVPRVLALWRWPVGTGEQGQTLFTSPLPWLYQQGFAGIGSDPRLGSLLFAVANLCVYGAIAWWMNRRGIYIRV